MENMELPVKKVKAVRKSPKRMVIYGPPKIGKTTAVSTLDNCLIIDLEEGSDMIDALKVKVNNFTELAELGKEIIKQKNPYKYIAIDTVTKLEESRSENEIISLPTPSSNDLARGATKILKLEGVVCPP